MGGLESSSEDLASPRHGECIASNSRDWGVGPNVPIGAYVIKVRCSTLVGRREDAPVPSYRRMLLVTQGCRSWDVPMGPEGVRI